MIARSKLFVAATAVVVAGAAVAFVTTRPEASLTDGALRVTPARLALNGTEAGTLTVSNRGTTPITIEVAGPTWVVVDPAGALVAPGGSAPIVVRAIAEPVAGDASVRISAGADEVSVPITLTGSVAIPSGTGSRLLVDGMTIDFGETTTVVERTISNIGSETLAWTSKTDTTWLQIEPASGALAPGAIATVRLSASRAGLPLGNNTGAMDILSGGGKQGGWNATVTVGDGAILHLLDRELDFGVGDRKAVRKLTFAIRNEGRKELRYQASVARVFLRLGAGASGTIAPGATGQVELTFDFTETGVSNDWVAQVPISSNGGSAALRVVGVSDWSGPTMVVGSNQMKFAHDHCSGATCERFRHLRATIEDPRGVVFVEAAMRVCTGSGEKPACDEWRLAGKGKRVSGNAIKGIYEVEIGPLPKTCVPGVGVIVHYRLKMADTLKNRALSPGSSTYYGYLHCSRAT